MKTITKAAVIGLILLIAAVTLTAGCVQTGDENTPAAPSGSTEPAGPEPADEPIHGENTDETDYKTAILGDWESTGKYTSKSGATFTQVYHFAEDGTGTLSAKSGEEILTTIPVMWAYDETQKAYMAFTPSTNNYDYLLLTPGGKAIRSEYGEIYVKKI